MKKLLLCAVVLLPMHAFADKNSVYEWGPWAEGIQPAAGPANVTPAPVENPQADVRESIQMLHEYSRIQSLGPTIPEITRLPEGAAHPTADPRDRF